MVHFSCKTGASQKKSLLRRCFIVFVYLMLAVAIPLIYTKNNSFQIAWSMQPVPEEEFAEEGLHCVKGLGRLISIGPKPGSFLGCGAQGNLS